MSYVIPFLIATLMGMGVGGGGLFVIYLTLCLNLPQFIAQGTNLCFFVIAVIGSLFIHLIQRRIYKWHVIIMSVFGSIGSILSSAYLSSFDPKYARIALGALLIIGGFSSLYNNFKKYLEKKLKKTLYK